MRKSIAKGAVSLVLLATLSGCSDLTGGFGTGSGHIAPWVGLDTEAIGGNAANSRAAAEITPRDLSITLTKLDGSFVRTWEKLDDFSSEQAFTIGDYRLDAFYGDADVQGFECPAYFGTQNLTVADGRTTSVALTASLANSMFSVEYSEAFQGYMSEWSAEFRTAHGTVKYAADETRPAYLAPGEVVVVVNVKKPSGLEASFEVATVNANPRYHYFVNVDVNNGNVGDATLSVTFDENLATETVEIDISDSLLTTAAPSIEADGFSADQPVEVVSGMASDAAPAMNMIALAGIKSVTMQTVSESLAAQGWPETIDLVNASQSEQATLTGLGLKALGLWKNPDQMAVVNFADVLPMLREVAGNNVSTFTLTVTDKLSRVSEPLTLTVNVEKIQLNLLDNGQTYEPGEPLDLAIEFNGSNVKENVKFQYYDEARGSWNNTLEILSVSEAVSRAMYGYTVTVATPELDTDLSVRAVCGTTVSAVLKIKGAPFRLSANENNVFATHATLSMTADEGNAADYAAAATILLSTDGKNFSAKQAKLQNGTEFLLEGLAPATTYYAKAVSGELTSRSVSFTTEAAAAIPNGDFEETEQTIAFSSIAMSGQWSISAGINYQSEFSCNVNEAKCWASINSKTCSGSNQNSWFTVPSTFGTNSYFHSYAPKIKVVNLGGWDGVPPSYTGFSAQNGENAMVLRNVAWDAAGTTPALWRQAGTREYWNHNVPTLAQCSAGRMFLGSYSYNGADNYNYGIAFASRPASLKGYYRYSTDDEGETAVVEIKVMNGTSVVASTTAQLAPAADFTEFNVALDYPANAAKATSLQVMFVSSNRNDADIKTTNRLSISEAYSLGATLVVDNLSLIY